MSSSKWLPVHGDEDGFFDAEHLRMLAMTPEPSNERAGTVPGEGEKVPAVWGTLVEGAIRRDDANGYYVTDRTLKGE